jgi:hypothetical protein
VLSPLRNKVFLIALACVAPVALGWAAYLLGWAPGAGGNYGELLAPRPLSGPALEPVRGKWTLVTFDAASCDGYCEKKLYYMRQVRRAQGKNAGRVERLWVLTEGSAPRPDLLPGIEGMHVASVSPGFREQFPHAGRLSDHVFLVDPLGNLMMRYPPEPDAAKMIKDLQRLLKYSRIG